MKPGVSEKSVVRVEGGDPAAGVDRLLPAGIDAVRRETERVIGSWLDRREVPAALREAMAYATLGGGKRLRPIVCWYSAAALGGGDSSGAASLPAGAAVELIHAFSLVHDDLPSLDDDDVRRGRPTLHRHTSEAMALLAGDGMLTAAFEMLLDDASWDAGFQPDARLRMRLCRELASGTMGMINGQVYDTLGGFPDGLTDREKLELVHHNKTGALLSAACRMGAVIGAAAIGLDERATSHGVDAIGAYARSIGLMFQVVDDLIDVEQPAEHAGKATGKDAEAGKLTYPGVMGVDAARTAVRELEAEALAAVEPLGAAAEPLRGICRYMAVRTK